MNKIVIVLIAIVILGSSTFAVGNDNDSFHFEIPLDIFFGESDNPNTLVGDFVYDEDTKQMTVEVDGVKTVYCGVPELLAQRFINNGFAEEFFVNYIKDQFEC